MSDTKPPSREELLAQIEQLEIALKRTQITLAVVISQRDRAMNDLADASATIALQQN